MVSSTVETTRGITAGTAATAAHAPTFVAVNTPTDRVRWGPIIAGLLCSLATLALLSVLGLAIGATSYDADDRLRSFGIGAGIWAAVSALIAFFVGGMLSARTAALSGKGSGTLQGAMVWVVAVPLLAYMMTGLVGTAARATTSAVNTAAQVTNATGNGGQAGSAASAQAPGADLVKSQVQRLATPENAEALRQATAKAAWGTLLSLVLGLAAASIGGMVGSRAYRRTAVAVTA